MKTNFNRQNIPFTMVANDVLSNPKLSWQAKGLYAYLYSKPEDWNFSVFRIVKETDNGKAATLAAIQELEDIKLLRRVKHANGRTTYWVTYPPNNFEPSTENRNEGIEKPSTENQHVLKIGTISKKECVPTGTEKEGERARLSYLENIPKTDTEHFSRVFKCTSTEVSLKARSLADYCKAKSKKYADYHALLAKSLRTDYGERESVVDTKPKYEIVGNIARRVA